MAERSKEEKQVKKQCKFKPQIDKSEKSYSKNVKETQHLKKIIGNNNLNPDSQPIEAVVKGLNTHIQRHMVAKQRKA